MVRQIRDALIAQARRGGIGTVTVDPATLSTHLRVRVADEGDHACAVLMLPRTAD